MRRRHFCWLCAAWPVPWVTQALRSQTSGACTDGPLQTMALTQIRHYMCIDIYIYTYAYTYIPTYTPVYTHKCVNIYIYMCILWLLPVLFVDPVFVYLHIQVCNGVFDHMSALRRSAGHDGRSFCAQSAALQRPESIVAVLPSKVWMGQCALKLAAPEVITV